MYLSGLLNKKPVLMAKHMYPLMNFVQWGCKKGIVARDVINIVFL